MKLTNSWWRRKLHKTATRETPLGLFQFGKNEKSLVVDGQFKSVKALKDLEIPLTISGQSQSGSSDDQSGSEMSSTGDNASSSSSQSQMSNQSQAQMEKCQAYH